jgi:hypothetical protein
VTPAGRGAPAGRRAAGRADGYVRAGTGVLVPACPVASALASSVIVVVAQHRGGAIPLRRRAVRWRCRRRTIAYAAVLPASAGVVRSAGVGVIARSRGLLERGGRSEVGGRGGNWEFGSDVDARGGSARPFESRLLGRRPRGWVGVHV